MGLQGKSFCLALAAVTLLSFNMCFLEEVTAKPHSHESASHHEDPAASAESHHHADGADHSDESEKSEDPCNSGGVVCCEDIVAVRPEISSTLANPLLFQDIYLAVTTYQLQTPFKRPQYEYQIDFSPGVSPPTVFLFSNTTHAPPVSL